MSKKSLVHFDLLTIIHLFPGSFKIQTLNPSSYGNTDQNVPSVGRGGGGGANHSL